MLNLKAKQFLVKYTRYMKCPLKDEITFLFCRSRDKSITEGRFHLFPQLALKS